MKLLTVYDEAQEAYILPRLIRLGPDLVGAAFSLMKLLPAASILDNAACRGRLVQGGEVVETTSGTFGLALALVCNSRGWRLTLVSDPVIDAQLQRRLHDLGAAVEIVADPAPVGGYQRARLERVAEILETRTDSFCPEQYSNPENPASYCRLAEYLVASLGAIDALVGPVGSGGSMCGTAEHLRHLFPGLIAIGIDTPGSVLFGQADAPRAVRGLGNSLMPANLDHRTFDEVHWLDANSTFRATRRLHQEHALFMGSTSGAAYAVGRWWTKQHPGCKTVVLLPDEGYRYLDTVYNDAWLVSSGYRLSEGKTEPQDVTSPGAAHDGWCRLPWARRSLAEVVLPRSP